jgi:hypothetical protein
MHRKKLNIELIVPEVVSVEIIYDLLKRAVKDGYSLSLNHWNSLTGESSSIVRLYDVECISDKSILFEIKGELKGD